VTRQRGNEIRSNREEIADPVLLMLGVGKQLWERERGDRFVERLRSEELSPRAAATHEIANSLRTLEELVWERLNAHEGEQFKTARGLPFTYAIEGTGIWFFRQGRRINRKLARSQVSVAVSRCPLSSTTEIKDLMDYPYLCALLTDLRIRGEEW
jgi:hypothetical protein